MSLLLFTIKAHATIADDLRRVEKTAVSPIGIVTLQF